MLEEAVHADHVVEQPGELPGRRALDPAARDHVVIERHREVHGDRGEHRAVGALEHQIRRLPGLRETVADHAVRDGAEDGSPRGGVALGGGREEASRGHGLPELPVQSAHRPPPGGRGRWGHHDRFRLQRS